MKLIQTWALTLCSLFFLNQAHAVSVFPISGINNLQWLGLNETVGLSRDQVESQMDTVGEDFYSWRYATVEEVETLTYGLWGGITLENDPSNFAGGQTFFDSFGLLRFGAYTETGYADGTTYWSALFGSSGECSSGDATITCRGSVTLHSTLYGAPTDSASFQTIGGLLTAYTSSGRADTASFLVRDTTPIPAVPIPAAVWLFSTGLGLLGFIARRKSTA